jgi:hypothetical protein
VDASVTPGGVLGGQPQDQPAQLGWAAPAAPLVASGLGPAPLHQVPVPPQDRGRGDDPMPSTGWGQQSGQWGKHRPAVGYQRSPPPHHPGHPHRPHQHRVLGALQSRWAHPGHRSNDGTTRLWDTRIESVAARICRVTPSITQSEWTQYLPADHSSAAELFKVAHGSQAGLVAMKDRLHTWHAVGGDVSRGRPVLECAGEESAGAQPPKIQPRWPLTTLARRVDLPTEAPVAGHSATRLRTMQQRRSYSPP